MDNRVVFEANLIFVKRLNAHACPSDLDDIIKFVETKPDVLCVALVLKGEIAIDINLQEFTFRENDMIIFSPDANKRPSRRLKNAEILLVGFSNRLFLKLQLSDAFLGQAKYFTSNYKPIWHLRQEESEVLKTVIGQLEYYSHRVGEKIFGREMLLNTFQLFLYEIGELATAYGEPSLVRQPRKKQLFLNFYLLAKRHFREERQLGFYANKLCITAKYLSETAKEVSGSTAGTILDTFVVEEARSLLDTTSLTVAEIADHLHFSDQSFFGKFFKRYSGLSPKQYRLGHKRPGYLTYPGLLE